jgi:hypothetical protein
VSNEDMIQEVAQRWQLSSSQVIAMIRGLSIDQSRKILTTLVRTHQRFIQANQERNEYEMKQLSKLDQLPNTVLTLIRNSSIITNNIRKDIDQLLQKHGQCIRMKPQKILHFDTEIIGSEYHQYMTHAQLTEQLRVIAKEVSILTNKHDQTTITRWAQLQEWQVQVEEQRLQRRRGIPPRPMKEMIDVGSMATSTLFLLQEQLEEKNCSGVRV